jgi:uncharacterized Zn finger protein
LTVSEYQKSRGSRTPSFNFYGVTMPVKCHNCGSIEETIRESGNAIITDCATCGMNKHIHIKEDTTDEQK